MLMKASAPLVTLNLNMVCPKTTGQANLGEYVGTAAVALLILDWAVHSYIVLQQCALLHKLDSPCGLGHASRSVLC